MLRFRGAVCEPVGCIGVNECEASVGRSGNRSVSTPRGDGVGGL
jgi:hypothetical protein